MANKKARKGAASQRNFGGAGKTDMFTLKTPKAGLTKAAAKAEAKVWRAKGYSAVVDHGVGGTEKFGVYVRKSKRKPAKKKPAKKAPKKK